MAEILKLVPYPRRAVVYDGNVGVSSVRIEGIKTVNGLNAEDLLRFLGVKTGDEGTVLEISVGVSADGCAGQREGYALGVNRDGISVSATTEAGVFYALVTFAQLAHVYGGVLPICEIEDFPRFAYRGLMLDCGRYFFPKEDVMRIADLCALHKINVLHLHLTEDQGWRIEIDKYPLLTEKGSVRSHTNFGFKPHGGYYTKQDIREIVAYCNARNIQVIPEFDVPGHSRAALACYPHLGCFDRKTDVATHSGVKHDIMCAGKESTYEFVFGVIDEIAELFADNTVYIHLGGDEAVKTRWKICPHCQRRIKELGLGDEEGLQAYFMNRVCGYASDKGLIPVVWNGTDLSQPCHEKTVWQIWTADGEKTSVGDVAKAAGACGGYVNSDSGFAYLDLPYSYIDLKKSYAFDPVPDGGDESKCLGAEAALWSEYVPDFSTACKRLLPRLCALSDAMWGRYGGDFGEFTERAEGTLSYLRERGFSGTSLRSAMPSRLRAAFQTLWFERRRLHWQGLHNLVENAFVRIKYSNKR